MAFVVMRGLINQVYFQMLILPKFSAFTVYNNIPTSSSSSWNTTATPYLSSIVSSSIRKYIPSNTVPSVSKRSYHWNLRWTLHRQQKVCCIIQGYFTKHWRWEHTSIHSMLSKLLTQLLFHRTCLLWLSCYIAYCMRKNFQGESICGFAIMQPTAKVFPTNFLLAESIRLLFLHNWKWFPANHNVSMQLWKFFPPSKVMSHTVLDNFVTWLVIWAPYTPNIVLRFGVVWN